jgi:hypothetical protein
MSAGTALYAIDLSALEAAIGSRDPRLVARVAALEADPAAAPKRKQLRIQVGKDGSVLIDGRPGGLAAAVEAYAALAASDLCLFLCRNEATQKKAFAAFSAASVITGGGAKIYGYPAHTTEAEFWADPDASPTNEPDHLATAVAALVDGKISKRIQTADYKRALERLCRVLGERLDPDDTITEIETLGLDSPLAKPRAFGRVPHNDDLPIVSYLTADEIRSEASRLRRIDLAFPDDKDVEAARRSLAASIRRARARGLGVVAFYS